MKKCRKLPVFVLLTSVTAIGGCSTLLFHSGIGSEGEAPCKFPFYVYGGVSLNITLFKDAISPIGGGEISGSGIVYSAVDFPFSVIADTILLPLSIPRDMIECKGSATDAISSW